MNVCLNRCLCTMCVPGTLAGHKGARALELELVMSHHVGSRSWRKSQYPNIWPSLQLHAYLYFFFLTEVFGYVFPALLLCKKTFPFSTVTALYKCIYHESLSTWTPECNALFVGEVEGGNEHSQHGDGRVVAMVTECLQWAQYRLSSILLLYTNFQTFLTLHYYPYFTEKEIRHEKGTERKQNTLLLQ